MSRGNELYSLGRYQDAIREFTKDLQEDPEDARAMASLANCYSWIDKQELALRTAKNALDLDPNDEYVHITAGYAYQNLGHLKPAENHFRLALNLAPDDSDYHICLGRFLTQVRKFKEAEVHLQEALHLSPDDPDCLQALSELYSETGQVQKALDLATKALNIDPDESDSHLALGISHLNAGNIPAAQAAIGQALRIKPNNHRAEQALRDAIRANFPIYRTLISHSRWIRSKGRSFQTGLWIASYFLLNVLGRNFLRDPVLKPFGFVLITIWVVGLTYFTVTPIIANIALMRHPLGKYALRRPQQVASAIAFAFIGLWLSLSLFNLIRSEIVAAGITASFGFLFTVFASIFYNSREEDPNVPIFVGCMTAFGALICLITTITFFHSP